MWITVMEKVSITVERIGHRTFVIEVGNLRVSASGVEGTLRVAVSMLAEEMFRSVSGAYALVDEIGEAYYKISEEIVDGKRE